MNGMESINHADFKTSQVLIVDKNGQSQIFTKSYSQDLGNQRFFWTGRNTDKQELTLSFTRVGKEIFGSLKEIIGIPEKFRYRQGRMTWLNPNPTRHLPCGGCISGHGRDHFDPRPGRRKKNWRNGDGNLVDLMVAYTTSAKSSEGFSSDSEVEAYVQNAISESNLCFLNSKVNAAIRLVHLVEVDYTETQDPSTDLDRSTNPSDGYLDQLHTIRDQYGADLVTLLVSEGDGTLGGIANSMSYPSLDFEDRGFNVVVMDQIGAPSYSLLHEIGHNMGCTHNREDAMNRGIPDTDPSNNSIFKAFNYGKRWIVDGQGYRTIMAYDTEDSSTYNNRIPYFSNPLIQYQGVTTGNLNSEDNAQVLSVTTPYVANFRKSLVQGIIPSIHALNIPEGNTSSLTIRLASQPSSNISISVSLDSSGDGDFSLPNSEPLSFSSENWNLPQTLQVSSGSDSDSDSGTGVLYLSSSGIPTASVQLNEIDTGTDTPSHRLVSGIIQNSLGIGISNVSLSLSSTSQTIQTDENGSFTTTVSSDWTGSITPSKSAHQFTPESISIESGEANTLGLSFIGNRSEIIYVDSSASGTGDGSNWTNAYTDLSKALDSTHPFSEVWVAQGTYKPGVFRSDFFLLPPDVSVYGGFLGSEQNRNERDSSSNPTILSGNIGDINDGSDNSFHVVVPSDASLLDGFFVQDGNATENYSDSRGKGAGLYASGVSFTVQNCTFQGNRARQSGGAVYLMDSNATFSNCSFSNNVGMGLGDGFGYAGAIYSNNSIFSLTSCSFDANKADLDGGAIFAEYSEINATLSVFSNNQNAHNNGGGAWALKFCTLQESNGTYSNQYTASGGGAIDAADSNLTVTNSVFSSNQADYFGGAIKMVDCNGTIKGSSFNGNSADSNGGAVYLDSTPILLENNAFTNNQSTYSGGGVYAKDANFTLVGNTYEENSAQTTGGAVSVDDAIWNESSGIYLSNTGVYDGGGLHLENTSGQLSDCNFTSNSNTTYNGGGALSIDSSSTSISGCNFNQNFSVFRYGGAIYMNSASTPLIDNCTFTENYATGSGSYGGAIYFWGNTNVQVSNSLFLKNFSTDGGAFTSMGATNLSFLQCRFIGNEANTTSSSEGGVGLLASGADQTKFINCLLSDNHANYRNGVVKPLGNTRFVNCTVVRNSAVEHGGISILFSDQSIEFENCILWQNSADSTGDDLFNYQGTASTNYCIVDPLKSSGTISGGENNNSDPLFNNSNGADGISGNADDDFSLQAASPAIDQANPDALNYSTTDISGKSRYGSGPDIGAYEYRVNSAPIISEGASLSLSVDEDETLSHTLSASDTDADNLTWSISSNAENGTASIDAQSGALSYQPDPNWYGTDSFSVSVTDGIISSSIDISVTVSSVDDLPVLDSPLSDQSMNEDQSNLSLDLSGVFNDVDTIDGFTYSVTSSNDSLVTVSVSGTDLILSLLSNQFGNATISIQATSGNQSISDSFNLVVQAVNDAPALSDLPTDGRIEIPESSTYLYDFNATDEDGDNLSFSISGTDASYLEINSTSGTLRFQEEPDFENPWDADQNNTYEIEILVSDSEASSQTFSLMIIVSDLDENAWTTVEDLGNQWKSASWFGTYFDTSGNWIFHLEHGWLYRSGNSMSSTWFFDTNLNWIWTNSELYPYFYRSETNDWIFYQSDDSESRLFYDYLSESWVTLSRN